MNSFLGRSRPSLIEAGAERRPATKLASFLGRSRRSLIEATMTRPPPRGSGFLFGVLAPQPH